VLASNNLLVNKFDLLVKRPLGRVGQHFRRYRLVKSLSYVLKNPLLILSCLVLVSLKCMNGF
jgi:hypothetical protein